MADTLFIEYKISDMLDNLFPDYTQSTTLGSYGFNYISFSPSDPTRLSGIAVNLNLSAPTKEERRRKGTLLKPGKFLRAVYPDLDRDTVAMMGEKLAKELMKSSPEVQNVVVIDTPSAVYSMDHGEKGELGSSCMRGCSKNYFEMYDVNPNTKMAYLCDSERNLIGRALLHEEVNSEDFGTIKLMDRIYVANGNITAVFKEWARNNGYWYKYWQNSEDTDDIVNPEDGRSHCTKLTIQLEEGRRYKRVPYMDSFKFFHKDFTLTTRSIGSIDTLEGTEGDSYENMIVLIRIGDCLHCSRTVMSDEEGHLRRSSQVVCTEHAHLYATCRYCNSIQSVDTVKSYDLTIGESSLCDACAEEKIVQCDDCGRDTLNHVLRSVSDSEGHLYGLCGDCVDSSAYFCNKHLVYHMDEECYQCTVEKERRSKFISLFEDLQKVMSLFNIELHQNMRHISFSHREPGGRITDFQFHLSNSSGELCLESRPYSTSFTKSDPDLPMTETLVLAIAGIEKMILDDAEAEKEEEERRRQNDQCIDRNIRNWSTVQRAVSSSSIYFDVHRPTSTFDDEIEIIPARRR